MSNRRITQKKIVRGFIIAGCILLGIYLGITLCLKSHFYLGVNINLNRVSTQSFEDTGKKTNVNPSYILELEERNGRKEQIRGDDIDYKYNVDISEKELKDGENPFIWFNSFFNAKNYNIKVTITYNQELLKKAIGNLACFDKNNITEPQNASIKYSDNRYVIIDEVNGNKVNKESLYSQVLNAVSKGERSINLESVNCYIKPEYVSSSQKVIDAINTLNKYISSKIIYTFGDKKEILDAAIINKWLEVDKDFNIIIHEDKAETYLNNLRSTYEKFDTRKYFISSSGRVKEVSGSSDWNINSTQEVQSLISSIKGGQNITKNPIYFLTGAVYNGKYLGNTYLAINLAKQHLWFYKNGTLIVEGDIVTGNVVQGYATPSGIYRINYKERNTRLKGQDYDVPVSYWMPFNGGIGLHDAGWRSAFGDSIYWANGSHGCVNTTYYVAGTVYNNINSGDLVICYY